MPTLLIRLGRHDERVLHALVSRRARWLDRSMRTLTHVADAAAIIPLVGLLVLLGPPDAHAAALTAAWALVLSHAAVQLLKRTVTRTRPSLPIGIESLVKAPDRFSFPSGHAAAAMSVALPFALAAGTLWGLLLLGLAMIVGLSRCYLGVHYPGDVVAGWLLAIAAVLLA